MPAAANSAGACRQLRKALRKMQPYLPRYEGVDTARLSHDAERLLLAVETGAPIPGFAIIEA